MNRVDLAFAGQKRKLIDAEPHASAEFLQRWEAGDFAPNKQPKSPELHLRDFKKLRDHLVIFVDVLGFGNALKAATSARKLHDLFRRLKKVQQLLSVPSALPCPLETELGQRSNGTTVLTLSDGVAIAVDGRYGRPDRALMLLERSQAWLHADGIFVRGGISHGRFLWHNNMLFSPALSEAYRLESTVANYPRIVIGQSTLDWVNACTARKCGPDSGYPGLAEVKDGLAASSEEPIYMLDYLRDYPANLARRDVDLLTRRERSAQRRTLSNQKWREFERLNLQRIQFAYFDAHRKAIERAGKAATNDRVKDKYAWLSAYHNSHLARMNSAVHPAACKLTEFTPVSEDNAYPYGWHFGTEAP